MLWWVLIGVVVVVIYLLVVGEWDTQLGIICTSVCDFVWLGHLFYRQCERWKRGQKGWEEQYRAKFTPMFFSSGKLNTFRRHIPWFCSSSA